MFNDFILIKKRNSRCITYTGTVKPKSKNQLLLLLHRCVASSTTIPDTKVAYLSADELPKLPSLTLPKGLHWLSVMFHQITT